MSSFNRRVGLVLFGVYLLLYGGFVYLAAFSPETLEALPFAGVNLAIWYGFGLIGAAFVLALVYGWVCRAKGETLSDPSTNAGRSGRWAEDEA